jgi:hypothetical protein
LKTSMQNTLPRDERGSLIVAPRPGALSIHARVGSLLRTMAVVGLVAGCSGREGPTGATPPVAPPMTVPGPPVINLSPTSLTFGARAGGIDPFIQSVNITSGAETSSNDVVVTGVTYGAGQPRDWIRLQVVGSILPAQLAVRAVVGELPAGVYTAIVGLAASSATDRPQSVLVTLTISP